MSNYEPAPAGWIPCAACGKPFNGIPGFLCPPCQEANDEALNPIPASVFDEPEFSEWAEEKLGRVIPNQDEHPSWYLHLLCLEGGHYDTVAEVARAYVDREKEKR